MACSSSSRASISAQSLSAVAISLGSTHAVLSGSVDPAHSSPRPPSSKFCPSKTAGDGRSSDSIHIEQSSGIYFFFETVRSNTGIKRASYVDFASRMLIKHHSLLLFLLCYYPLDFLVLKLASKIADHVVQVSYSILLAKKVSLVL